MNDNPLTKEQIGKLRKGSLVKLIHKSHYAKHLTLGKIYTVESVSIKDGGLFFEGDTGYMTFRYFERFSSPEKQKRKVG